jgi:hypothetical protein
MGFSIAYCDNDLGTARENFIGSMVMPKDHANDNYITADYFGSLLLRSSSFTNITPALRSNQLASVYPNPAKNVVKIERKGTQTTPMLVEIRSATGALVKSVMISGNQEVIEIGDLLSGMYVMSIISDKSIQSERIIKR